MGYQPSKLLNEGELDGEREEGGRDDEGYRLGQNGRYAETLRWGQRIHDSVYGKRSQQRGGKLKRGG